MTNTNELTYDSMVIKGDCGDRLWLEVCGWSSARLMVCSQREDKVIRLPLDVEALDAIRNEITLVLSVMSAQRLASVEATNPGQDIDYSELDDPDPDDLPF